MLIVVFCVFCVADRCWLFVVCCLLFVRCLLNVGLLVWLLLFVVCCLLSCVCCLLFVARDSLFGVC